MSQAEMDVSDDGQIKSSGDDFIMSGEEDENDLEIKPPQATRDFSSSRRRDKGHKEKKRGKEKRHKERPSLKDREREKRISSSSGGNISGRLNDENERHKEQREQREQREHRDRERRSNDHREHRDQRDQHQPHPQHQHPQHQQHQQHQHQQHQQRRDDREHYHQRSVGYEREESGDRRYIKMYENSSGTNDDHGYHHHHYAATTQYHYQIQKQRQNYYEHHQRTQSYHSIEYQNSRHQSYTKHNQNDTNDYESSVLRDRRKHNYDQTKDPESLEQDLRSRLLSKRHKYVTDAGIDEDYERNEILKASERNKRNYGEENNGRKSDKHKKRKKSRDIIEVLDSPEHTNIHHRRKHKHRSRDQVEEIVEKRKTPDDPELLARRAKFLAAEREKEHRKELAREELEARREKHKERIEVDMLSPSHVAASVTAGLHIIKRKTSLEDDVIERKKSRKKISNVHRDVEVVDEDDEISSSSSNSEKSDDSASESNSDSEREGRKKSRRSKGNTVHLINDSPLSVENLDQSPPKHRIKSHKKHLSKKSRHEHDLSDRSQSVVSGESMSDSESGSRSRSEDRRSRSGSSPSGNRSRTHSISGSRSRSRSISQSRSRSRSISGTPSSRSRSISRSRSQSPSRSRTRSEERDMKSFQHKSDSENISFKKSTGKNDYNEGHDEPAEYDPSAEGLPNYFPGVQGCRSVEEFQCLNRIEEGTYGVVYRAKDKRTNEIVALKRLKMEKEKEGFPITSLREINTLLKGQHPNIVTVREIVVGSNMDKIFIVMDYVEHDLKSLMETMKNRKQSFFPGEIKCLTQQLLKAVRHLHDNWILHRDLKTSNLLLSHKGILKVGDFGLAREYGSPLKKYTSLVVTLWYRAPELLLCASEYSTPIDVWSVGCIFAEFLQMSPLFPGKSEIDELNKIFKELGTPSEKIWPGYNDLPAVKNIISQNSQFAEYPVSNLKKRFTDKTTELGIELLQGLLTYDPKKRLTADAALKHPYFRELPLPIDPSMFPTWPAKSELGARKAMASSPKPPSGGLQFKQLGRDDNVIGGTGTSTTSTSSGTKIVSGIITGNRKTVANTGFVLNAGIDQRQLNMGPGFSLKF